MSERALRGPEGEPGQDGRPGRDGVDGLPGKDGERGADGVDGKDGRNGVDGKHGEDGEKGERGERGEKGERGERGEKGKTGSAGKDGQDGEDGPMGPMPDHQWRGTELAFQRPDGALGRFVNLKGPQGQPGASGGGGGGMTKTQALQLNTLLAIFGGWISTVPDAAIEEVTIDELDVTVDGSATGYYSSIPGGEPVEAQYEWDWGDGSMTVDELTAEHTYAESGTYTISFRAKNHIGWSDPATQEVTVSGEVPVNPDPYWEQVVLLLNGNALVDGKGRHTLIEHEGDVTSVGGMLNFDGSSSLRIDDLLSDFSFADSWTIEGQIDSPTSGAGTRIVVSNYNGSTGTWEIFTRGAPNYNGGFYAEGGAYLEPATPPWVTDSVKDWAISFNAVGHVLRIYIDGVKVDETALGGTDYSPDTPPSLFIGRENAGSAKLFVGRMRLRITNGVARYVGDSYTPPTWPLSTT